MLRILFLQDDDRRREDAHPINWLVAKVGGIVHGRDTRFHHVELVFKDEQDRDNSTSIYQGGPVFCSSEKTFANPCYKVISITVSKQELQAVRAFVDGHVKNQTPFSAGQMYLAMLPVRLWPRAWTCAGTFCSRYVTEALQAAHVGSVQGLDAGLVSPSKLFRVVNDCPKGKVAGSVRFKEWNLSQNARLVPLLQHGEGHYERLGERI